MKKILASLAAVTFLGSSTLAVSACGVSDGKLIPITINNAPEEAEANQDPTVDYVYNNKYGYNITSVNYLVAVAANLASDKIYYDNQKTLTGGLWDEFYSSKEWRSGNFTSFHYDLTNDNVPSGEKDFSFKANNDQDLIYQIKGNDASIDDNKLRIYWFITSPDAWSADNPSAYKPTKNNITIPSVGDFTEENQSITKLGWVHLYLLIGAFRLDFSAEINFIFNKVVDKNGIPVVVLSLDSLTKPFGDFKFEDAEEVANQKIVNLTPTKPPVSENQ